MVLFGCNYPVVLRQVTVEVEGPQVTSESWELIGEICVNGIMYGEAMGDLNDGKYTEESYCIC